MTVLRSRDNDRVKRWAKLTREARSRRAERATIAEGIHLVEALATSGLEIVSLLVSEERLEKPDVASLVRRTGRQPVVVSESVFAHIVEAESPQGIAAEIPIPERPEALEKGAVFLEGIQDPGNVGAILRSAAAFGLGNAVLDRACADPWSPKVLRSAMGGHFALSIRQVQDLGKAVLAFKGRTVCAATRGGTPLREADLAGRVGWILGAEGQGVSPALAEKAEAAVTVALAAGAESLNVGAAAAVCFYEAFSRRAARS